MASYFNLEVDGYRFTLFAEDILKHLTSRLATMVANCAPNEIIKIDRDGRVFQYVASYLVCGNIPRNENGAIRLDPLTLASLREEARYFGLDKLFAYCDQNCKAQLNSDFHSYVDMHKYIQKVKKDSEQGDGLLKAIYATSSSTTPLLTALGQIWNSFCIAGKIYGKYQGFKIVYLCKRSTIHDLKVDELIADAKPELGQRLVYAIPAKGLNKTVLSYVITAHDLVKLTPYQKIAIVCEKLLIHQKGYFHYVRPAMPSTKGEGHIGTLVVILNSEYTGGELEVTHGGRTEVVTGPYSWVAMYGDCLHKINPVTSGTRVSLIYDIYAAPPNRETRSGGDMEYISTIFDSYSANIHKALGASENTRARIHHLLKTELQVSDTIYIALQQLYAQCLDDQLMQQPDVLTLGDRALYDALTQNNQYDVSCRSITVYHMSREWINSSYHWMYSVTTTAQLFPSSSHESATVAHTDSAANALSASDEQGPELKKQKCESLHPPTERLIVATTPAEECVMYKQERAEWTGTKSLPKITVYLLRTLQVRTKHT